MSQTSSTLSCQQLAFKFFFFLIKRHCTWGISACQGLGYNFSTLHMHSHTHTHYTHTHFHKYTHTAHKLTHTQTFSHTHTHTHTHDVHTFLHTHTHSQTNTHTQCTHSFSHTHILTQTHTYTYFHTHTHTHTVHTHTHSHTNTHTMYTHIFTHTQCTHTFSHTHSLLNIPSFCDCSFCRVDCSTDSWNCSANSRLRWRSRTSENITGRLPSATPLLPALLRVWLICWFFSCSCLAAARWRSCSCPSVMRRGSMVTSKQLSDPGTKSSNFLFLLEALLFRALNSSGERGISYS